MCICILECSDKDVICPEKWDIVLWSTVLILILSEIAGKARMFLYIVLLYFYTDMEPDVYHCQRLYHQYVN